MSITAEDLAKQILVQVHKNMEQSFNEIRKDMDENNKKLKEDISSIKDSMKKDVAKETSTQVKRKLADVDCSTEIKKKGNRAQFKVNYELLSNLDDAVEHLNENSFEKAKAQIEKCQNILKHRIKLIRLADREELGWDVVNCFLNDDLASNSDDEKQIVRARREANVNKKKEDQKRSKQRKIRYNYNNSYSNRDSREENDNRRRSRGICYICGSENHFQYDCPRKQARSTR